MRKKSKRWLVNFPTYLAVISEHIQILITPARKLRSARKYILIGCAKIMVEIQICLKPTDSICCYFLFARTTNSGIILLVL